VAEIKRHPLLHLMGCSPVYESDYVGPGEQAPYLNACVLLGSGLEPRDLLETAKGWEKDRGRRPAGHMRPRPLDVDILLFGDRCETGPALEIPHPRLMERLFVLAPLADLSPEKIIPNSGETVADLCAKIRQKCGQEIRPWAQGIEAAEKTDAIMED